MSNESPAEICWLIMLAAKECNQADAIGRKIRTVYHDQSDVCWIKFLAADGLIEIIDDYGVIGIHGLTAKGALVLTKATDRESWITTIGPIIEAGESISLHAIENRRWYRRLFATIKDWLLLLASLLKLFRS